LGSQPAKKNEAKGRQDSPAPQSAFSPLSPLVRDPGKPRFLISDLCIYVENYLPPDQIREVYRAYLFGAEAHDGQHRLSGEPYIYHPLAVARILADLRMDYKCLMAAILHDVIEDTPTAKEQLTGVFDREIADLVDGVSKLNKIDFRSRAEAQAANFRKMLLAMTRDIRVILIKLADRLHNMRTLGIMRPEKCRRIARETLEIYAPIAKRLGINSMCVELEELGFAAYWPMRARILKQAVKASWGNRKETVAHIEAAIRQRLQQEGLSGHVIGREKHLYGIYQKMYTKKRSFNELVDVVGFRIIVDRFDTCYRVLGAVHNLYKPIPGKFKDYVAIPKANGYQSLHTALIGPQGMPIEIQIRTEEMHRIADAGIAAHWLYKLEGAGGESPQVRAHNWLQNLLELQKQAGDSVEFLEHVKVDLFPDEVYVFTPRGRIMVLPRGSTVIDFAYAVHTELGNSCVAARIERRLVPLRTRLVSGQTIEVITATNGNPNPAWLDFVVTAKARANIRSHLKNLQHQEALALGRRLLDKELQLAGVTFDKLPQKRIESFLETSGVADLDALFLEIGLGNRMPFLVARGLRGDDAERDGKKTHKDEEPLVIKGTEGMVVGFAKCCRPIPGDAITGVFTPGRGIVVHRQCCPNLGGHRRHPPNRLALQWHNDVEGELPTEIRVAVDNQRGVLATVAATIAETGSNIENVAVAERDGLSSTLRFLINVRDRKQLATIMRRLRVLPTVMHIARG